MTEEKVEDQFEQDLPGDQQGRSDDIITVVLTADNHLGSTAFGQQPWKREELRQRLCHAFQQATDFAVGQGVDFFVQAGDLFDTSTPDERDRSFVAARLAQLRQAGIRTFALGGVHDTPPETHSMPTIGPSETVEAAEQLPPQSIPFEDASASAPQISYARLGALHYFAPNSMDLEPVMVKIRNVLVGICGLGVLAGQEGDPLTRAHVQSDLERADISLLVLHAPLEGLTTSSSLLDTRAQVSQSSIENRSFFRYILAGYHHSYRHMRIGQCDVIVAGATQHIDFSNPEVVDGQIGGAPFIAPEPGFVFLGLGSSGIRWCKHITVDTLLLRRLVIHTNELWPQDTLTNQAPTDSIFERLLPLCSEDAMVQLRLEGQLTRSQYHQIDLNQIRRYGEEHCFTLAIDDSGLDLLQVDPSDLPHTEEIDRRDLLYGPAGAVFGTETEEDPPALRSVERFSPREELVALADEWIATANDEQEKNALRSTKEALLAAMDEVKIRRYS